MRATQSTERSVCEEGYKKCRRLPSKSKRQETALPNKRLGLGGEFSD